MELQEQIAELRKLQTLLISKEYAESQAKIKKESYNKDIDEYTKKKLPPMPEQPKAPVLYEKPLKENTQTPTSPLTYLFGFGFYVNSYKKKKSKEIDRENQEIAEDNRKLRLQYEQEMKIYDIAMEQYKEDLENYDRICDETIEKAVVEFMEKNEYRLDEIDELKTEAEKLGEQIAAIKVLADKDKHLSLVTFVLDKLESYRADSLMMALNLYDAQKGR